MAKLEESFNEELFKRELYQDTIKPLVEKMDKFSESLEYEKAQEVLNNIKKELKESKSNFPFNILTIKDTYDLIMSNSIRLDPENYSFSDFLGLVISVHNRRHELKGMRYSDINRQRKIVAEEMACLGMTVPDNRGGKGGKSGRPNRAFLDVAHKINPFIACKEIERREKVMMWKAIESGKKEEIENARKRLRKYLIR